MLKVTSKQMIEHIKNHYNETYKSDEKLDDWNADRFVLSFRNCSVEIQTDADALELINELLNYNL